MAAIENESQTHSGSCGFAVGQCHQDRSAAGDHPAVSCCLLLSWFCQSQHLPGNRWSSSVAIHAGSAGRTSGPAAADSCVDLHQTSPRELTLRAISTLLDVPRVSDLYSVHDQVPAVAPDGQRPSRSVRVELINNPEYGLLSPGDVQADDRTLAGHRPPMISTRCSPRCGRPRRSS